MKCSTCEIDKGLIFQMQLIEGIYDYEQNGEHRQDEFNYYECPNCGDQVPEHEVIALAEEE